MGKKLIKIAVAIDPHLTERNPRCRRDSFFETAMSKLEYLAENNDYVVIPGDIFHIHTNSMWLFNVVYSMMRRYPGKFHASPGNHDVFHRNLKALNKTTLGALFYTGALKLHTDEFTLAGLHFVPVIVDQSVDSIPVDEDNNKILIAHKFYEQKFSPEESLFESDIRRLNYNTIFLGHDHKPYDDEFVGNSVIVRMGSLTRIDTQWYNRDREICYYQITTDGESGKFDFSRKIVPHKKTSEIYTEEAYALMGAPGEDKAKKNDISFIQIGDVLSKLTKSSTGTNSLDRTLRALKAPERSISDIKWRHEINNVSYT